LKKPTGSVSVLQAWNKKTEPKLEKQEKNRAKAESNQFEPVFVLKNQTKTSWFEPVSVFLKKNWLGYFFYKNQTELKMIPLPNCTINNCQKNHKTKKSIFITENSVRLRKPWKYGYMSRFDARIT
jgi:hypothetical protein